MYLKDYKLDVHYAFQNFLEVQLNEITTEIITKCSSVLMHTACFSWATHLMALLTSPRLKFGHVIASFIVAAASIDVAALGHL